MFSRSKIRPVPCELNLKATIIIFNVNVTHKPTIIIFNPDIRLYVRVIVHVVSRLYQQHKFLSFALTMPFDVGLRRRQSRTF